LDLDRILGLGRRPNREELRALAVALGLQEYRSLGTGDLLDAINKELDRVLGPAEVGTDRRTQPPRPPEHGQKRRADSDDRDRFDESIDGDDRGSDSSDSDAKPAAKSDGKPASKKATKHPSEVGGNKSYARAGLVCSNCHWPKAWHQVAAYGDACPYDKCDKADNCPCTTGAIKALHPDATGGGGSDGGSGGGNGGGGGGGGSATKKSDEVRLAELEHAKV
jgi:hypothetical protein